MALHFLKLSSIFGNFRIIVLNDFMEHPRHALRCIASTILASSLVSAIQDFLGVSSFPVAFPMSINLLNYDSKMLSRVPSKQHLIFKYKIWRSLIAQLTNSLNKM
ncbi:hypothetical protein TSUD_189980 [Trifolium subterraneum]|uniref:Uncharacterized protein n=1 Tax=Trifolium subterraneum TaxID=3900 RepID=A0A2Z6NA68_TRISU|nr:hypothetical protein TSUD_189980 [Trifolium subterraneum]